MTRLRSAPPRLASLKPALSAGGISGASAGWAREDGRSSAARGYGADWRKVRAAVLADEPLCRFCAAEGRIVAATQVDHIEGFNGVRDARRLDRANLQPLCAPCHAAKTARSSHGG